MMMMVFLSYGADDSRRAALLPHHARATRMMASGMLTGTHVYKPLWIKLTIITHMCVGVSG